MNINFVTSNYGKVNTLRSYLSPHNINVQQVILDFKEIQADNVEDIALQKAADAYNYLQKPVLVSDGGLLINALNNFPGPYTKYVIEKIGCQGVINLLSKTDSMECKLQNVLVYKDQNNEVIFSDAIKGTISKHRYSGPVKRKSWGEIWRIFIPKGETLTLAELSNSRYNKARLLAEEGNAWKDITKFLKEKTS